MTIRTVAWEYTLHDTYLRKCYPTEFIRQLSQTLVILNNLFYKNNSRQMKLFGILI